MASLKTFSWLQDMEVVLSCVVPVAGKTVECESMMWLGNGLWISWFACERCRGVFCDSLDRLTIFCEKDSLSLNCKSLRGRSIMKYRK